MKDVVESAISKVIADKWLGKTVAIKSSIFGSGKKLYLSDNGDRTVVGVEFYFTTHMEYDDWGGRDIPSYAITIFTETLKAKRKASYNMELDEL